MNRTISLFIALMAAPLAETHAQAQQPAPDGDVAVASQLEEFLTAPLLVPMQKIWEKRGGWGGILTAKDGTVVAFQSPGGGTCRRSRDGGTGYPGLHQLADGTLVATTYGVLATGEKPSIVSLRFTMGEVDSLAAKVTSGTKP